MPLTIQTDENRTPEQLEKELESHNKYLENNPDKIVVRNKRAEIYFIQKNYIKCMADCQHILKLNETNAQALVFMAGCYMAVGDKDKASENLLLAVQFNDQDHVSYFMNRIREWDTRIEETGYEKLMKVKEQVNDSIQGIHKLIGESIEKDWREHKERVEKGKKAKEAKTVKDSKGNVVKKKWVRCGDGTYRKGDDC